MHCATAEWLFKTFQLRFKLCSRSQISKLACLTAHMHESVIFLEEAS